MKTTLLFCTLLLLAGCGNSKKSENINVPSAVKESFSKQFPTAINVKWSMEAENEYEAEYEANDQKQASNYDGSGKWLVTETEISESNLPDTVKSALANEFEGYKIIKAEKVETPEGTSYELKFEKGEVTYVVDISSAGAILKSKKEKEDEDGDEEDEDEDEEEEDGDEN